MATKGKAMKRWLTVMACGMLLGSVLFAASASASSVPQALTSAPPDSTEAAPFGIFDPNHLYLDSGSVSITRSTGQVTASVTTLATQVVDSIGATVYIQRWNGTAWVTEGAAAPLSTVNDDVYAGSVNRSATSGYYYRARVIHWINEGSTYEQGEMISSSVLVP